MTEELYLAKFTSNDTSCIVCPLRYISAHIALWYGTSGSNSYSSFSRGLNDLYSHLMILQPSECLMNAIYPYKIISALLQYNFLDA